MQDAEDEDDPVVQELNVFLSKQLSEDLYVFQYPIRSVNLPYDNIQHTDTKMKPVQQKVQFELTIDTDSPNYSRSHGEQMSLNAQSGKNENIMGSGLLDRQKLISTSAGVKTHTYAIGSFLNGQVYLTPVKGIVQLRPSLDYLDQATAAQLKLQKESGDGAADDEEEEEETVVVKQRIRANESEEAKARRLASYEFLRQQQEDEEYVSMRYHCVSDEIADHKREKLFAVEPNPVSEFYMSDMEYGEKLMATRETEKATQLGVFSLTDLKFLPLGDQVTALMKKTGVLHFQKLMSLLPAGTNVSDAINHVQNAAVLIRGIWVAKSEVLYPKDWASMYSGVSAEKVCRVRDYILCKFSQNLGVSSEELDLLGRLPEEDEMDLLCKLASHDKEQHTMDWIFAYEPDTKFIAQFPYVVEREERVWQGKSKNLSSLLNVAENHIGVAPPRSRKNSGKSRKTSGSERMLSDHCNTDVENQTKTLTVKAPASPRKRTHSVAFDEVDDLINEVVAKESRLEEEDDLPIPIVNIKTEKMKMESCHMDGLMPPEQKMALVEFIRKQLHEVTVTWISMLHLRLQKHLAGLSPGHILGRGGISDLILEQSLLEAGGVRMASSTVNGEAVYILPQRGDPRDTVRAAILQLLNGRSSLKIGSLRKKLTDASGEVPSDNELKKVLKEYCETRGGCWHLKGTVDADH